MSEDWQKVKELFHAAIEREPLSALGFLYKLVPETRPFVGKWNL